MLADELTQMAFDITHAMPHAAHRLHVLAGQVRRLEIAADDMALAAQEEAEGEAMVAALNLAKRSGLLVELADVRCSKFFRRIQIMERQE